MLSNQDSFLVEKDNSKYFELCVGLREVCKVESCKL